MDPGNFIIMKRNIIKAFFALARTLLLVCVNGGCFAFVIWQAVKCINVFESVSTIRRGCEVMWREGQGCVTV